MQRPEIHFESNAIEASLLSITGVHFAQWERVAVAAFESVVKGDRSNNEENVRLYHRVIKHGVSCFQGLCMQPGVSAYLIDQWFEYLITLIVPFSHLRSGITRCSDDELHEISTALFEIAHALKSPQKAERVQLAILPQVERRATTRFKPNIISR